MQALERSNYLVSCGGAPLSVIQHYINQQDRPQTSQWAATRLHREHWLEFGRSHL